MNKTILAVLIFTAFISCDKNSFQQTTDSIKNADSLFTTANNGLKTLDSISKTINNSDGIAKKVIIPEIQKQKKAIDSTIKSGGYQIDSINKEISKITKNVVVGTEVVKTLDSANDALNNGESAFKVLTRTADKILRQTKKQTSTNSNTENQTPEKSENRNSTAPITNNPIVKTTKMEIEVDDISSAKNLLENKIRENNADLISANYSEKEGFQREYMTVKVPLQNFDRLVSNISSELGNVKSKETESEGVDYISGQMCDVEITLVQKHNTALNSLNTENTEEKADDFGSKSSNAFMSGFKVLGTVLLAVLPFWPLFLIAGLVWYLIRRNKIKKEEAEKFRENSQMNLMEKESTSKIIEKTETKNNDETDYSKYLPKK